jgi:bile acid-coenzyme A ligase
MNCRYDLSSLATMLHMGAACPPWLKQSWIERLGGDRLYERYATRERRDAEPMA